MPSSQQSILTGDDDDDGHDGNDDDDDDDDLVQGDRDGDPNKLVCLKFDPMPNFLIDYHPKPNC